MLLKDISDKKFEENGSQLVNGKTLINNIVKTYGCFYDTTERNKGYEEARNMYKKDLYKKFKPDTIKLFSQTTMPIRCYSDICKNSDTRNIYGSCEGVSCMQNVVKVEKSQLIGIDIKQIQECGYDVNKKDNIEIEEKL
jgi:hypothetical protein